MKSDKSNIIQIERRRVTDQIIEQLVSMIASGKLNRGDKLPPEHLLMKQFGVGRSSLREAIGALSLIGVVTVHPGRGTHVAVSPDGFLAKPFSWGIHMMGHDKVHELIEARLVVEQAIVELAAERATEEDIAEIKLHQEQLKATKKYGREAIKADLAFHNALAKASHNSILTRYLFELRHSMQSWMEQKVSVKGSRELVIEQHDEIMRAIETHDSEMAQSALRSHLQSTGDKLAAILLENKP